MRRFVSVLLVAVVCAAGLWSTSASADEARSPFQLLSTAQVATDGTPSVDATPVRWGWGGYYRSYRPYYGVYYYGGYYPYRSYYGYRYPSYGYYPYGYRSPYYTGYRGWYGGWY